MKLPLLFLASVVVLTVEAQVFTPGNLAVVRLGDGVQTLLATGNQVSIDQYSRTGVRGATLSLPSSGASALTMSGTATSEGALTRSADGRALTLMGYNTQAGVPAASSLPNSTAATTARALGQVDSSGFRLIGTTATVFGGNGVSTGGNPRSAVTDGAGNYWGVGAGNATSTRGTYYFGTGAAAGMVQSGNSPRVVNIFNGDLYYSVSSTTAGLSGLNKFGGLPMAAATASLALFTGDGSSPYDFAFNPAMTLAYVADDRTSASGGIQRWELNGATWTLSYTLSTGTGSGARGLAVDFTGDKPTLFATTTESSGNRLIQIQDTGAGSSFTLLATAGSGQVFRGVDFVPVPEPQSVALVAGGLLVAFGLARRRLARC